MATMTAYTATNMELENFNARYLADFNRHFGGPMTGAVMNSPFFTDQSYATQSNVTFDSPSPGALGEMRGYVGDNLVAQDNWLVSGTITYIEQDHLGTAYDPEYGETYETLVETYSITGIAFSAATLHAAELTATTNDDNHCYALIFAGDDTFIMSGEADAFAAYAGNDTLAGKGGNDTADGGSGDDVMGGGSGDDLLIGGSGADYMIGNSGADVLKGGSEDDTLCGNSGDDTLQGSFGNDRLIGAAGTDSMTGGSGADIFVFNAAEDTTNLLNSADLIDDFKHRTDKIDVSAIDAFSGTPQNDAFVWRGHVYFSGDGQGEIRFDKVNNIGAAHDYTVVYFNTDGTDAPEFIIRLQGLISLTAADFIL